MKFIPFTKFSNTGRRGFYIALIFVLLGFCGALISAYTGSSIGSFFVGLGAIGVLVTTVVTAIVTETGGRDKRDHTKERFRDNGDL